MSCAAKYNGTAAAMQGPTGCAADASSVRAKFDYHMEQPLSKPEQMAIRSISQKASVPQSNVKRIYVAMKTTGAAAPGPDQPAWMHDLWREADERKHLAK